MQHRHSPTYPHAYIINTCTRIVLHRFKQLPRQLIDSWYSKIIIWLAHLHLPLFYLRLSVAAFGGRPSLLSAEHVHLQLLVLFQCPIRPQTPPPSEWLFLSRNFELNFAKNKKKGKKKEKEKEKEKKNLNHLIKSFVLVLKNVEYKKKVYLDITWTGN